MKYEPHAQVIQNAVSVWYFLQLICDV
jgi:hypothetical protein